MSLIQITLCGRVSPVGGVKEKVLGAHCAGMNKVIVLWVNWKDVESEVPKEVRAQMQFMFARTVCKVLDAAFEGYQGRRISWKFLVVIYMYCNVHNCLQ